MALEIPLVGPPFTALDKGQHSGKIPCKSMANYRTIERFLGKPKAISRKTWREALRNAVGPSGERLWSMMLELAEGRAWRPTWQENGVEHVGEPVVPTSGDRLAAMRELAHMLFGKPVPQTEAANAEHEAREVEAARALTDAELEARVRAALGTGDTSATSLGGVVVDGAIVASDKN